MFKRIAVSFALLLSFLLAGCSAANSSQPMYSQAPEAPAGMPASGNDSAAQEQTRSFETLNSQGNAPAERLVIKNAKVSIAVDSPPDAMQHISSLAEEMGGYIVSANLYQMRLANDVEVPHATITIRVPAERLDEALQRIKSETTQPVLNESISSQDVTGDYTDLQSQLRNLEAAESQLQEIMGGATKTEDVLSVYNQLVQVRGQIEVIKGQIQYYEQSAALSAIDVDLQANEAVQPLTAAGWQPVGVVRDALQSLINAVQFLATAAIWIVLFFIPVLFFVLLPIFVLVLLVRRWRSRRKSFSAAAAPVQDK